MKERPILFSAPMVRALMDGSKTQTRRIVKPPPQMVTDKRTAPWSGDPAALLQLLKQSGKNCPYGHPSDRLWVREAWGHSSFTGKNGEIEDAPKREQHPNFCHYSAEWLHSQIKWKPGIHMPRWASRILLEVVSVRVEHLQDITEADCVAEGIERLSNGFWKLYGTKEASATYSPKASYHSLWEQINGAGSWALNPWVWVVEFKRITP